MNNFTSKDVFRFFFFLILQALILKNIALDFGGFNYIHLYIYPLFFLLLPFGIEHTVLVLCGFAMGLSIDLFYFSLGVHTSASVASAFLRPYLLGILEPRGSYVLNKIPSKHNMGFQWTLRYIALAMSIHIMLATLAEVFNLAYFGFITLKTILSTIASVFFIFIYMFLFNPKD